MGRTLVLAALVACLLLPCVLQAQDPPADPCIACHQQIMPGVIKQWEDSKHSDVGVGCVTCHTAREGDPSGHDHNGFQITAVPSPLYCADCHPQAVEEHTRSKHAWSSFLGPLKPYYLKAKELGLDPTSQETIRQLDPEEMAKRALTPLFPDSGILAKIGLLDAPHYNHNNVNLGCIECHGSAIVAEPDGKLLGWPNAGVGRINPDGSLGSCSYCHTRHGFSIAEARKPETCGQCHLGPDHPQHEIYEESKHGNIYASSGEDWNWDAPTGEWGPTDITAPTCSTCHMSGFGGAVPTTHDVGERLYWELQPKKSVPQWKGPDEVDLVTERIPDIEKAERGREEMKKVCYQCHSSQWADNYLVEFDKVVDDYNQVWAYTDALLKQAYDEGLADPSNPIDETPEIMHYLIWHHDGRRWRMGASMMGPDWTHWNGAVDAIMNKLGTMINDIEMRRRLQTIEVKLEAIPGAEGAVSLSLMRGLNMISMPLQPTEPYTARSLAQELGATVVIRLDEAQQRFVGYTLEQGDEGFVIESGKGYIVNMPESKTVTFTGSMWQDEPSAGAPQGEIVRPVWAFVISGVMVDTASLSASTDQVATIWVRNHRTGVVAQQDVSAASDKFSVVLADMTLAPVVQPGDMLEVYATNAAGEVISYQPAYHVRSEDLTRAYVHRAFDLSHRVPKDTVLGQNYPNPFNPETWIPYELAEGADVLVRIYTLSGQTVRTLELGYRSPGVYVDHQDAIYWDGRNDTGHLVGSGVYFYDLVAGDFTATRKMVIRK